MQDLDKLLKVPPRPWRHSGTRRCAMAHNWLHRVLHSITARGTGLQGVRPQAAGLAHWCSAGRMLLPGGETEGPERVHGAARPPQVHSREPKKGTQLHLSWGSCARNQRCSCARHPCAASHAVPVSKLQYRHKYFFKVRGVLCCRAVFRFLFSRSTRWCPERRGGTHLSVGGGQARPHFQGASTKGGALCEKGLPKPIIDALRWSQPGVNDAVHSCARIPTNSGALPSRALCRCIPASCLFSLALCPSIAHALLPSCPFVSLARAPVRLTWQTMPGFSCGVALMLLFPL